MRENLRLPSELTLPHLGRLAGLELAGEGAAGWILRAGDVGVKVARASDEAEVARLRREAILRAIVDDGAPLDGARIALGRRKHAALAFRWIEGSPLSRVRAKSDDARRLLDAVVRDVGDALARLHVLGFRHGDVKPENVLVRREKDGWRASLVDFGLAAPFAAPLVGGTPAHLPPEALESGRVDAAADVWALGKTLTLAAQRFDVPAPTAAKRARAKLPGDRPTAAMLAGWQNKRVPVDAAYVVVRLEAIERAVRRGEGPPAGRARAWVQGVMRALAGLDETKLGERAMPALDAEERRAWLVRVAGEDARDWSTTKELDEDALIAAIEAAGTRGAITRGSLAAPTTTADVSLADALARLASRPDDAHALDSLRRAAMNGVTMDETTAHATTTLLRRAGEISAARAIAENRTKQGVSWCVEAAELARLAGDRAAVVRHLEACGGDVRALALRARLAVDEGDATRAEKILEAAPLDDPFVAEARARLALLRGRFDDGLAALAAAETNDPEQRARATAMRGVLLHGRGDPAAALRAFTRSADLALAIGAAPLEATARASAAAAGHDAGKIGDALEAADRAIALLERLGRRRDVVRARLNRAAALVAAGARADAMDEARRARDEAEACDDRRAAQYARYVEIDAATIEGERPTERVEIDLDAEASAGDRLAAFGYARLAGVALDDRARATATHLALDVDPAWTRWIWWRASLLDGDAGAVDAVLRASDFDAPPSTVGPTLAAAIALARKTGRGDAARALSERLTRVVERLTPEIPLDRRAAFDAQSWVRAARPDGDRAEGLGLGAAQIELLSAITRGLRDRTSLGDLLRQIVDGLVLWVGVERGLLLLRAPGADESKPRLVPRVARGLSREDLRGDQLALSTSLAQRALETLEPVVAVDAAAGDELSASIHALRLRSILAVPLVARGEAVGVVYLDDRVRRGAFGPREIAWVRLLATQAAAAIADARDALRLRRLARRAERAQHRLEEHLAHTEGALEIARAQLATTARVPGGGDPRGTRHRYDALVGDGPAMRRLLSVMDRVTDASDARVPVLIVGESGTGKELVARALHENGPRRARPFVAENCGAIPEPLLESTLFGHVRGAFTGADRPRVGLFEVANGGTLFLDEVGEMGAAMQAKLLRVLQDGDVRPVGSEKSSKVDVRVVAATHRDLAQMVRERRFREDLYYRLAVVLVKVPALRERSEDVPTLVEHFVSKFAAGRTVRITRRALAALAAAPWPGNVRQLENELRRALVLCDVEYGEGRTDGGRATLDLDHLSPDVASLGRSASNAEGELSLRDQIDALERRLVGEALRRADGNQTRAARALGLSRFGLQKMLKRLGIGAPRGASPLS